MSLSEESATPGDDFASGVKDEQTEDTNGNVQSNIDSDPVVSTDHAENHSEGDDSKETPIYSFCEPSPVAFKVHVYRKLRHTGHDYGMPEEFGRVSVFVDDKPFDARICETIDRTKGNASDLQSDTAVVHTTTRAFEVVTDVLTYGEIQRYPIVSSWKTPCSSRQRRKAPDSATLQIKKVSRTYLVITSLALREVLRTLIGYYPHSGIQHSTDATSSIIHEPYAVLMQNYDAITNYADTGMSVSREDGTIDSRGSVAVRDMVLLRDFLKPLHETLIEPTKTLLTQTVPQITFEMVWYIFPPGTQVYVQSSEGIFAAVVSETFDSRERWDSGPIQYLTLELWRLDTDGSRIARTPETQDITSFTGVKDVTALPICPVSYWDPLDGGSRRQKLLERSRMHIAALRKGYLHVRYEGPDLMNGTMVKGKMVLDYKRFRPSEQAAIGYDTPVFDAIADDAFTDFLSYDYIFVDEEGSFGRDGKQFPRNPKGRMVRYVPDRSHRMQRGPLPVRQDRTRIIGHGVTRYRPSDSYAFDHPPPAGYQQQLNSAARVMDAQMKKLYGTSDISEEQLLLLNPESPAFDLTTKRWHIISTDGVRMVEASNESISNLILPDNSLQTIRALSSRQQKIAKGWSADFIEGKGAGQIILLHGPPGVGKTYTVESIAEWLQRPLLALTVADIGTTETTVEQELLKWFDLAEAWDAVLLVDEADVFLEQRRNRDLARNSLVTAFLRRMEYFKGLLFLTTNRVGQIDDAFISRVHVTIEYEALSKDTRARIWNGFFGKLQRERKGKITVAKRAKEYVLSREISLNGREIRNTLQTAISLASFQADEDKDCPDDEPVIVEEGHFKDVLDMSEKFHKYVASIRREDEAKRANIRGDRNDYGQQ